MDKRTIKIGSVKDKHGKEVLIAISPAGNTTIYALHSKAQVIPFTRRGVERLIALLQEALEK